MPEAFSLYCIKNSPTSYRGGWLGKSWGKEIPDSLFEWLLPMNRIDHGILFFSSAEEAFSHIREKYPEHVWIMQVYRAVETSEGITFTHVPWPE